MMSSDHDAPSQDEVESRKKEVRNTLCCPHCNQPLKKWAVPQTHFTEWPNEFMYICFNDECSYFIRGWEAMARLGNTCSYRLMYDPELDCCQPVPVLSKTALKESIIDESKEIEQEKEGIDRQSIVGTWKLTSSKLLGADGQPSYPLGQEPQGMLTYFEDGRMTVQNIPADGTLYQSAEGDTIALETYGAYSGTYELVGENKIVHNIENSIQPGGQTFKHTRSFYLFFPKILQS